MKETYLKSEENEVIYCLIIGFAKLNFFLLYSSERKFWKNQKMEAWKFKMVIQKVARKKEEDGIKLSKSHLFQPKKRRYPLQQAVLLQRLFGKVM